MYSLKELFKNVYSYQINNNKSLILPEFRNVHFQLSRTIYHFHRNLDSV